MPTASYIERRGQLETYFDRTAVEAWRRLTSTEPVGRIRATVRKGRDEMRGTLLSWLPDDLTGCRILDAGCGTGALAMEAAARGADVVAIDISPKLIGFASERAKAANLRGTIDWQVGDMMAPTLGRFDHVVAMDSLIHYDDVDVVKALAGLFHRVDGSIIFTFAPRTPLLAAMHSVGRLFPKSDRSPTLEPLSEFTLRYMIGCEPSFARCHIDRSKRVSSGFYTSQAMELRRI